METGARVGKEGRGLENERPPFRTPLQSRTKPSTQSEGCKGCCACWGRLTQADRSGMNYSINITLSLATQAVRAATQDIYRCVRFMCTYPDLLCSSHTTASNNFPFALFQRGRECAAPFFETKPLTPGKELRGEFFKSTLTVVSLLVPFRWTEKKLGSF